MVNERGEWLVRRDFVDPELNPNASDDAVAAEPLVWHPWIRGLAWVCGWWVVAISTATVWEFAATGDLRLHSTLARGAWILLAIGLFIPVLFTCDLWWKRRTHVIRNYERRMAVTMIAVETLVVAAFLMPYFWLLNWVPDRAWLPLHEWGIARDLSKRLAQRPQPSWIVWVALPVAVIMVWTNFSMIRHATINYTNALQLLGFKRTVVGVLLMSFLRLRQPRRDFFFQAPIISWIPWLAMCVILHVVIPTPVLNWLVPAALLCWTVPIALDMIVPPTWLFLGKSDFASFAAFDTMRRCWRQHGLTLLNRVGAEGFHFYVAQRRSRRWSSLFFDPAAPRVWSLRTRGEMWQHTVLLLMDYALVVVVDMRGDSDIVRDELCWLAMPSRAEKAWYLVSDDGHGAVLVPEHVDISNRSRLVTEEMLFSAKWSRSGLRLATAAAS